MPADSQTTWARLKNGDSGALQELFKEHYVGLMNYGLKMTGDRSLTRDCITQMLLNLHRQWRKLPDVNNIRSYLITSLRNEILAEKRLDRKRMTHAAGLDSSDYIEVSYEEYLVSQQMQEESRQNLKKALSELTERERELLRLRYFEDKPYDEIATTCGITKRTAYNIIHAALKRLKEGLMQQTTNKFAYISLMNMLAAGFI